MALVESRHEMILGALPVDWHVDKEGWSIDVLADGCEPGTHEAVVKVQEAFRTDGAAARRDRDDNATTTFRVMITGPTTRIIGLGESALRRVLPDGSEDEPTPFIWRPADGVSPAAVRDIVVGDMTFEYSDLDEIRDVPRHTWKVTLTHLPFVRAEFPTRSIAPVVGPVLTTVVIDTCDSATGWTGRGSGGAATAVSASGGAISITLAPRPLQPPLLWAFDYELARTGVIDFASTPYLVVEAATSGLSANAVVGGVQVAPQSSVAISGGRVRHVFDLSAHPASPVVIRGISGPVTSTNPGTRTVHIYDVRRTSDPNASGTPRQSIRTLDIGGTERTPATMHVSSRDGATSLGLVALHLMPDTGRAQDPDVWRWRISGPEGKQDDPTAPMGARQPLHSATAVRAEIPASAVAHASYSLCVMIDSPTAQRITLGSLVAGIAPGSGTGVELDTRSTTVDVPAGISWVSYQGAQLPPLATTAGKVAMWLWQPGGTPVTMIGWWAMRADDGASLQVLRVPHPHLWIDARRPGRAGRLWVSATDRREDGYCPPDVAESDPTALTPPRMTLYVASSGADAPSVDVEYYEKTLAHATTRGGLA